MNTNSEIVKPQKLEWCTGSFADYCEAIGYTFGLQHETGRSVETVNIDVSRWFKIDGNPFCVDTDGVFWEAFPF